MQRAVERVHEELLAGLNPEFFADCFWDHDLEFRGDFDPYLLHILRTPNDGIDRQLVCQQWHRSEIGRAGCEHAQNGTESMSVSFSSDGAIFAGRARIRRCSRESSAGKILKKILGRTEKVLRMACGEKCLSARRHSAHKQRGISRARIWRIFSEACEQTR